MSGGVAAVAAEADDQPGGWPFDPGTVSSPAPSLFCNLPISSRTRASCTSNAASRSMTTILRETPGSSHRACATWSPRHQAD